MDKQEKQVSGRSLKTVTNRMTQNMEWVISLQTKASVPNLNSNEDEKNNINTMIKENALPTQTTLPSSWFLRMVSDTGVGHVGEHSFVGLW